MAQRVYLDLIADRRLVYEEFFEFLLDDFAGATFAMQVRTAVDTTGPALINLGTVADDSDGIRLIYAGTDTITNHIAAGRLTTDILNEVKNKVTGAKYVATDSVLLSQIRVLINQATMEPPPTGPIPLPPATGGETGDNQELAYDLLIAKSGSFAVKYYYGKFIVLGAVTQP